MKKEIEDIVKIALGVMIGILAMASFWVLFYKWLDWLI